VGRAGGGERKGKRARQSGRVGGREKQREREREREREGERKSRWKREKVTESDGEEHTARGQGGAAPWTTLAD